MSEELSRQERKERTRQAILDAALELSADGGLANLSLRSVAKRVKRGSTRPPFPSGRRTLSARTVILPIPSLIPPIQR